MKKILLEDYLFREILKQEEDKNERNKIISEDKAFQNKARSLILPSSSKKVLPKRVTKPYVPICCTNKFKGLINRSNTCYINCILQTLFMVPEMKNRIIKWNLVQDARCMLSQLQKLFIKLEVSENSALPINDFGNSFMWVIEHQEEHQDVHEFFGVLLNKIQESTRHYKFEDIVDIFYRGNLIERLRCVNCNNTKCKDVPFLQLQLPVMNMEGQLYDCLEDIIDNFTKAELLTGNDRLMCDNCSQRSDTEKGNSFKTLPYILNFSLSRFRYDSTKSRFVKLCSKISFTNELTVRDFENKTFEYELISVIVHKGSINLGHYVSYIRDVSDNKWYLFDDKSVYYSSLDEVERMSGCHRQNTAYLFTFRLKDSLRNEEPIKKNGYTSAMKLLANSFFRKPVFESQDSDSDDCVEVAVTI